MARLLLVHAHPDDETLTCGVTMAHHVARGDEVHVLTCTLGEEGEVIPPGLAHLEGDPDDRLGPHRHGELLLALERLGAVSHVLGADPASGRLSRYRDSGMVGSPAAARPEAFAGADLDEAAGLVADVVRDVRPDVVVTYEEHGGYGHPDHVQAHRVTRRAMELLGDADLPRHAYEIVTPLGWAREDRAWLQSAGPDLLDTAAWWADQDLGVSDGPDGPPAPAAPVLVVPAPDDAFAPSVVDDDLVTHVVHDAGARAAQNAALRAHATQVVVASEDVHALSNLIAVRTTAREGFRQVDPRTWRPTGRRGTDLLA
ncbi:PIG-L family deacetylase [Terrabacter sp. NPDC000476]|uniref:PIG-L family deacetylase n=1 Tax=Terrabacter sp. NPDC000476 TaxID=3154258 RepID=UPI00332BA289